MKVKSYLPIFPGFYNTIFDNEFNEDNEIEYWRQETKNNDLNWDDLDFDYVDYHLNISKDSCNFIEEKLKESGFNIVVHFEELISPKYYNYSNDSINVTYEFDKDEIRRIKTYLLQSVEDFEVFIENRYTSRSGFISSYSNDHKTWLFEYIDNIQDMPHILGSIFEFIITNEGEDPMYNMYEYSTEGNCLTASLKETT